MRVYASAWLTFSVRVDRDFRSLLEEEGALRRYNEKTGASLGFLDAGKFAKQELYITSYCEKAEPLEPVRINPYDFDEESMAVWTGQIHRFLTEHGIPKLGTISLRLIADLDD